MAHCHPKCYNTNIKYKWKVKVKGKDQTISMKKAISLTLQSMTAIGSNFASKILLATSS